MRHHQGRFCHRKLWKELQAQPKAAAEWGFICGISSRITPGWAVLAKRWIVERTFAWLNHFPRLSKDYEISAKSPENMIMIVHAMILLKRLP